MKNTFALLIALSTIASAQAYECVKVRDAKVTESIRPTGEPRIQYEQWELRNSRGEVLEETSSKRSCQKAALSCEKVVTDRKWSQMTLKSDPMLIETSHYVIRNADGKLVKNHIGGFWECRSLRNELVK